MGHDAKGSDHIDQGRRGKLLQIVLSGQQELDRKLEAPEFRQLKQRIALRCDLAPLTLPETASYIAARIRTAGGDSARVFTREAVMLIHERSGGIPRVVSVICDNALVTGFALERRPVGHAIVLDVCRDFDLRATAAAAPETQGANSANAAAGLAGLANAEREPTAGPDKRQDVSLNDPEMTDVESAVRANKRRMFSFF